MGLLDLDERYIDCPYCGEAQSVLLNAEEVGHSYIEDCQVCCRPIEYTLFWSAEGDVDARVSTDSD